MRIGHKFECVEGEFDTDEDSLVCVPDRKYTEVHLCFKCNMNIPFAQIRLHSRDLYIDAKEVFEDACKLGEEIVRRWNLS